MGAGQPQRLHSRDCRFLLTERAPLQSVATELLPNSQGRGGKKNDYRTAMCFDFGKFGDC